MTAMITDDQAELDRLVRFFPLTPDSLVWIAGGWYGAQVRWFADYYQCRIMAFEPQPEAFAHLQTIQYPKLELYNFGLGEKTELREMCKPGTDACSYITHDSTQVVPGPYIETQMVDVLSFMNKRDNSLWKVDLFLMNMEGYELILLPYMMANGLIYRFGHIMTQFHLGWDGGAAYPGIRRDIEATHELIWEYRTPAWVTWKRK